MNHRRVTLLRDKLRTVHPAQFDINWWCKGRYSVSLDGAYEPIPGGTGCAGVWATTIPELRADGLRLSHGYPKNKVTGSFDFDALQEIFELNRLQTLNTFLRAGYLRDPSPAKVARRLTTLMTLDKLRHPIRWLRGQLA